MTITTSKASAQTPTTSRIVPLLVAGIAIAAMLVVLAVVAVAMPDALKYFFGFTTANATAAATAILAGMDIATAVSIFGGATAIGGIALAALRRAIGKKALVQ